MKLYHDTVYVTEWIFYWIFLAYFLKDGLHISVLLGGVFLVLMQLLKIGAQKTRHVKLDVDVSNFNMKKLQEYTRDAGRDRRSQA